MGLRAEQKEKSMAIKISAELLGDEKFVAMLSELSNEKADKAIAYGVKFAARSGKLSISKGLRDGGLNLASGRIKADLKDPKFRANGTVATIHASYDPVTATSFKAKQNARGLGVTFYKGQRHQIKGGFYAKGMPLARVPGKRWPAKNSVRFIHGPSIAAAYLGGSQHAAIKAQVDKLLEERLAKGIMRRLSGFMRGF